MLKIKEVENELRDLLGTDKKKHKQTELNKINKRIQFLRTCKSYLEENPSQDFVNSEYCRLKKIINSIRSVERFRLWQISNPSVCADKNERQQWTKYESDNNLKLLRLQLKTLQFIKN